MCPSALSDPHELSFLSSSADFHTADSIARQDQSEPRSQEHTDLPGHRSHDPENNLKRTDPFQFGSRFLEADDNVFEFNAWDHVIPDEDYDAYAEAQFASQRASPVSDFDKKRFNSEPAKWWNKFYSNNTSNFFKNRKWLRQEFPVLSKLTSKDSASATILEVGAGAGNTAFPILAASENEGLMIHACDFSSKAVDLIKNNEAYDPQHIQASVWDLSVPGLPEGVAGGSVDVVLLIFVFSALHPKQWSCAVENVFRALKPGGEVCFRDYGYGDLTQVRFKKGRLLEERFYIRGDGTRVYFFTEDELKHIWGGVSTTNSPSGSEERTSVETNEDQPYSRESQATSVGQREPVQGSPKPLFHIVSLGADRRMIVNRKKELKMYRCWMQGHFKKPLLDHRA